MKDGGLLMFKEVLKVENLSKTYSGNTRALKNVSFKLNDEELVSIIGPSGAGKSTLLRSINQMIDPDKGSKVYFDGNEITGINKKKLRDVRKHIGMIFQHYNLIYRLTALENVLHGRLGYYSTIKGALSLYENNDIYKAVELLDLLGLKDRKYFKCANLSGGQKQRVGIARALIQNPKIILCDEPISSLDPQASKVIMEHLKYIVKEMKIPCLVNLHQVDVAKTYSDRIIGMSNSEIVFDGHPSQLTNDIIELIYGAKEDEILAS